MPTPTLDALFGAEYRRIWDKSLDLALITYGSMDAVSGEVYSVVRVLTAQLPGVDVNIALLALTHIVRESFLVPMSGR